MGMSSRSSNAFAQVGMKVVSTGFEMAEAANEMKELLGEFCGELVLKIVEIDKAAANRPGTKDGVLNNRFE